MTATERVRADELVPGERILYARTWFRIERCVPDGAGWVTLVLDDGSGLETTTDALWTVKR